MTNYTNYNKITYKYKINYIKLLQYYNELELEFLY